MLTNIELSAFRNSKDFLKSTIPLESWITIGNYIFYVNGIQEMSYVNLVYFGMIEAYIYDA